MYILVTTTAFQTAWKSGDQSMVGEYAQQLRAIMKTNFDLRPERHITFVGSVFNGRGPPQLTNEGARDDLIKIFVLRHYKVTTGMKGFKVVMCDSEYGSEVTAAASHRVDIGMRTKYTIVSIYNRLFDTSATSLRPTKFVSAGKLQYYCELPKGELPGGSEARAVEQIFEQRLRSDLVFAKVRDSDNADPYPRQGRSASTTVDDGRGRLRGSGYAPATHGTTKAIASMMPMLLTDAPPFMPLMSK